MTNVIDSMARNAIPYTKLGDSKAVREGSERTVLMPNGQKVIMVSLNGEWVTTTDGALEYTAETLPDPATLSAGDSVVLTGTFAADVASVLLTVDFVKGVKSWTGTVTSANTPVNSDGLPNGVTWVKV